MDRKSILILVACFALLMLWVPLVNLIYPPIPAPRSTNIVAGMTGAPPQRLELDSTNRTASTPPSITMPTTPNPVWLPTTEPEQTVVLENGDGRYTFTSRGGGLKWVELKEYPELAGANRRNAPTNRLATLNLNAPVPALTLLGGGPLQDTSFQLVKTSPSSVRAEKHLTDGLVITKQFALSTNHVVVAMISVENQSTQAVALPARELVIGTAVPLNIYDPGQFLKVQWYDGNRATVVDQGWFANRTLGCLPGTPRESYQSPGQSNVVWGAVHNQFFTMIAIPRENAPYLTTRRLDLLPPTLADRELARQTGRKIVEKPFGFETALAYPGQVLAPGQKVETNLEIFAGPKEYNTLAKLSKNVDLAMNFSAFFGWFAKALLLSMNGLHRLGLSYGATIIVITIIIKTLFWPLTQASTRSMKRMQAFQPQMKALQEKYKDDPRKMNMKLMEFMKERKISPLGGCLPMMLQIPVFIGFYQMLQSAIELRGAQFLWATDLSQPDTVGYLLGFPVNPLPLLMGATQFWQARLTPASPGMDPVQQKMMQYMPLMFIFILYNFPAGLALYWAVQNLLSILQMKLTRAVADTPAGPPAKPGAAVGKKRA